MMQFRQKWDYTPQSNRNYDDCEDPVINQAGFFNGG